MAQDPADRPGSAGELARELESALADVGDTKPTLRGTGAAAAAGAVAPAGAAADTARADDTPQAPAKPPPRKPPPREPPPREPRRDPANGGSRRGLAAGLAALLLAVAAVVVIATLNSGGDDQKKTASGSQKQQAPKKKTTTAQQTTPQAAAEPQQTQATPTAPVSGGNDPAQGARLDAQGFRLIQQGQYAQAVPIERQAVAAFPSGDTSANHAYALFNLGTALNRSGKSKEAIPYLEKRLSFSNDRREVVQKELDSARKNAGG
jgi:tetratricopeptide (TPR) repeat protein